MNGSRRLAGPLAAALLLLLNACEGASTLGVFGGGVVPADEGTPNAGTGMDAGGGTGGRKDPSAGTFVPAPAQMRRLTSLQYARAIEEVFGNGIALRAELEADETAATFLSQGAGSVLLRRPVESGQATFPVPEK